MQQLPAELLEDVASRLPLRALAALSATCRAGRDCCHAALRRHLWRTHWRTLLQPPCPVNVADMVWFLCTQPELQLEVLVACLPVADVTTCQRLVRCVRLPWPLDALDDHFRSLAPFPAKNAFYWAACGGHVPMLHFLVDHFGDAAWRATPGSHQHALMRAAVNGHVPVMHFLAARVSLTAENARCWDNHALVRAAEHGHLESVKCLREVFGLTAQDARAQDNGPLRSACWQNHVRVAEYLAAEFGLTAEDARACNNIALRLAAEYGQLEAVQFLVRRFGLTVQDMHIAPVIRYAGGFTDIFPTAFQAAAERGHLAVLQFMAVHFGEHRDLMAAGARGTNNYALRFAAGGGHVAVMQFLRAQFGLTAEDARARGEPRTNANASALDQTIAGGEIGSLRCLFDDFGLTADDAHNASHTALFFAAHCGHGPERDCGHARVLDFLRTRFDVTLCSQQDV